MKKRRGRPLKPETGKRGQVTTLLRGDLKRLLQRSAMRNGRTVSQELEHWLERLLVYESVFLLRDETIEQAIALRRNDPVGSARLRAYALGEAWPPPKESKS